MSADPGADRAPPDALEWRAVAELVGGASAVRDRTDEAANKLLALLSKQRLFQALPYETRVELSRCAFFEREPKKGAELISQHELARYGGPWRLVLAGAVEVRVMSPVGKTSHEVPRGEAFGDPLTLRALPSGTAYYSGQDSCAFLCISAEDYARLLASREDEELDARVRFFRNLLVPLFASWSNHQVRELARRVYPRRFASRQVIVREGEAGCDVFFLVQGECRVVREIEIAKHHSGKLKKMVKLLELAVLQPQEYFGELAPFNVHVDHNGRHRTAAVQDDAKRAKRGGGVAAGRGSAIGKLHPQAGSDASDDDAAVIAPDVPEKALQHPGVRQATVFSYTPLEVLVFPAEAMKELLVGNPLQRMKEYAKGYPTAMEIKNQYAIQNDWATFKTNLVKDVINH